MIIVVLSGLILVAGIGAWQWGHLSEWWVGGPLAEWVTRYYQRRPELRGMGRHRHGILRVEINPHTGKVYLVEWKT